MEIAKSREVPKKVWKGFSTREVGSNSEGKSLLKNKRRRYTGYRRGSTGIVSSGNWKVIVKNCEEISR